ncbi:hypothetical protein KUX74_22950, partial [Salmonella enterica subsp. enterica serovar Montevideo]|nr:hypothetical protein [Salmonella enterica subsp. enterica serovar Montevideo]
AGKSTWEPFYFAVVCGLIYLVFTTVSNGVLLLLERRYSVGVNPPRKVCRKTQFLAGVYQ